eukprot:TRINITY_DN8361_c0_g1_i7.p2 TRINITY_DN8361_c0_g1~~TRINITY_DN8361_c0_g1_i7.p2  ORF type:complete len:100 (-),score=1.61 TRINITY_DN8361_c0_g1_i7:41-340(-)
MLVSKRRSDKGLEAHCVQAYANLGATSRWDMRVPPSAKITSKAASEQEAQLAFRTSSVDLEVGFVKERGSVRMQKLQFFLARFLPFLPQDAVSFCSGTS